MFVIVVEHRRRPQKREPKYSVQSECSPTVVGPAGDWHEAFAYVVRHVCIATLVALRWSRRGHQVSGEAENVTKNKLILYGAHFLFNRTTKA